MHGQGVDELPGRGEDGAPLKHGEGERGVVGGYVQLEGGVDADEETHGQDHQFPQLHRVHQGPGVLSHLHGQSLCAPRGQGGGPGQAAVRKVGLKQGFDVVHKRVFHVQPGRFQLKAELVQVTEEALALGEGEAQADETLPPVILQIAAGREEALRAGSLGRLRLLSLADQDGEVEVGLVVQLVVHLQVPTADLHTVQRGGRRAGLLPREGARRRGHVEKDTVQREPQQLRGGAVVGEVVKHGQAQPGEEHLHGHSPRPSSAGGKERREVPLLSSCVCG